ncbi:MAG TPA: hypothetical protein VKK61_01330 [Tepidisphaeraceae bacterium]|nr:hypothetical protein [Tepidisphaeraceae bacterium]
MGYANETAVPSKPAYRAGDIALIALSLGILGWLFYKAIAPQSVVREAIGSAMHGPEPTPLRRWHDCDGVIAAIATPKGNLVVDFRALAATDHSMLSPASSLYIRAVYTLWPRRIFAATPGVIITEGSDLAAAAPPSDPAWLAAHDVRRSMTLHPGHNQSLQIRTPPDEHFQ